MRLARPSAFVLAVLTAALIWTAVWHMTPEVSRERPAVNGPATRLQYASTVAPFRCDSLFAKDCFEMFHRHITNEAVTTVPFTPVFDRGDLAAVDRADSDACLSGDFHRGDRCLMGDNR